MSSFSEDDDGVSSVTVSTCSSAADEKKEKFSREKLTQSRSSSSFFASLDMEKALDPEPEGWVPKVVKPIEWRNIWGFNMDGARKLTISYAFLPDESNIATHPNLHLRNWYISKDEPGKEIASHWGVALSAKDLENLVKVLKNSMTNPFRTMTLENLSVTITQSSVRLQKTDSKTETRNTSISIPHDEVKFLLKIFPFFIQLFKAIEDKSQDTKLRLLELLLFTFAVKKMFGPNYNPDSLFYEYAGEEERSSSSFEDFVKSFIKHGFYDPKSFEPFAHQATKYKQILNLPDEEVAKYIGTRYIKDVLRVDTYMPLRSFIKEVDSPRCLIYAAQLLNSNFFR